MAQIFLMGRKRALGGKGRAQGHRENEQQNKNHAPVQGSVSVSQSLPFSAPTTRTSVVAFAHPQECSFEGAGLQGTDMSAWLGHLPPILSLTHLPVPMGVRVAQLSLTRQSLRCRKRNQKRVTCFGQ